MMLCCAFVANRDQSTAIVKTLVKTQTGGIQNGSVDRKQVAIQIVNTANPSSLTCVW